MDSGLIQVQKGAHGIVAFVKTDDRGVEWRAPQSAVTSTYDFFSGAVCFCPWTAVGWECGPDQVQISSRIAGVRNRLPVFSQC